MYSTMDDGKKIQMGRRPASFVNEMYCNDYSLVSDIVIGKF
jgi:hypothetical protein